MTSLRTFVRSNAFSKHSLFGINNSVLFGCFISEEVKELVISSVNRITSPYNRVLVIIFMPGGNYNKVFFSFFCSDYPNFEERV